MRNLCFFQSRKKLSLGAKSYKTVIFLEGTGKGKLYSQPD